VLQQGVEFGAIGRGQASHHAVLSVTLPRYLINSGLNSTRLPTVTRIVENITVRLSLIVLPVPSKHVRPELGAEHRAAIENDQRRIGYLALFETAPRAQSRGEVQAGACMPHRPEASSPACFLISVQQGMAVLLLLRWVHLSTPSRLARVAPTCQYDN
jgi:hypothetical protein